VHTLIDDLPLFSAVRSPEPDPLADLLDSINPDDLTPRDALEALYQLKAARTKAGGSHG
jgi:DNA mismatch repair protein MutS